MKPSNEAFQTRFAVDVKNMSPEECFKFRNSGLIRSDEFSDYLHVSDIRSLEVQYSKNLRKYLVIAKTTGEYEIPVVLN